MREITLPQNVRTFRRKGTGSLLGRTDSYLEAGTTLTIDEPRTMVYDHRDQVAVEVVEEKGIFLLVQEIGLPELVN